MNRIRQVLQAKAQPLALIFSRRAFGGGSKITEREFYENLISTLRRKKLLLRAAMTKKHKIILHPPESISKDPIRLPLFNLSELAGHGSFVFLALSYLESDFLNLRLYALSGITLSILFQYYREIPLWIPIRWNALFLLINTVMIGLLIKKQSDAANMTEDQKLLYEQCFKNKGMSQVDFFHLISKAKRMEAKKGTKLVSMDKKNTRLYLVQKGSLSVYKHDQKIGKINQTQFVGEMSYLRWQTKKHEKESIQLAEAEKNKEKALEAQAEEFVTVGEESILHWKKMLDASKPAANTSAGNTEDKPNAEVVTTVDNNSNLETGILSFLFSPFSSNNINSTPIATTTVNNLSLEQTSSETVFCSVSEAAISTTTVSVEDNNSNDSSSNANNAMVVTTPVDEDEGHLGQADVICDEDCIVYYWKFKDLYQLISDNPLLGLVIERSFSEDLNNKMSNSWQGELMLRYKMMLSEAVQRFHLDRLHNRNILALREDALLNNSSGVNDHSEAVLEGDAVLVVNQKISKNNNNASASTNNSSNNKNEFFEEEEETTNNAIISNLFSNGIASRNNLQEHAGAKDVKDLDRFRTVNNISDSDHQRVLQEVLAEQEKRDRERVAEKIQETAVTKVYRTMLRNELKRPKGVSDAAKRHLREYRLTHHVSADIHVALLQDFGWTLDEYEMGRRLTAKDVQYFKSRASSPSSSTSSPTSPSNKKSSIETLLTTRYGKNATLHFDDDDLSDTAEMNNTNNNGQHMSAIAAFDENEDNVISIASQKKKSSANNQASSPLSESISTVLSDHALQKRAERIQHALSQAGLNDSQHLGGDHPIEELHLHLVLDDDVTHVPVIYTTIHPLHHHKNENNELEPGKHQPAKEKTRFFSRFGWGGVMQTLFPSSATTASTGTEMAESSDCNSTSFDGSKHGTDAREDIGNDLRPSSSSPSSGSDQQAWVPGHYLFSAWSNVYSVFYGASSATSSTSTSSEKDTNTNIILDSKTKASSGELSPS